MKSALKIFKDELVHIVEQGLYKDERILTTLQRNRINTTDCNDVINMCANNYLGLTDNPDIIEAAKKSFDEWGYGLASVRFICGTQQIHKNLEAAISRFLNTEDTILYSSCFDANSGLFESLLSEEDAILSDELNHASIIDGIRLCKAKRYRYKNNDMDDLKRQLEAAKDARIKLIATDGVFSMDGYIADLQTICDLADEYNALVIVDDSHAVGFIGNTGRGTVEYCGVMGRVDIITGTLGKALGGASGGYTSGRKEIIALLRQRSRPYLFSNTLAPSIVSAALKTFEIFETNTFTLLRNKLFKNTIYFRSEMAKLDFDILPGTHPIVPVMLYDAKIASEFALRMLKRGIYVVAFSYPVVPKGKARIRVQISARHTKADLDKAVQCFKEVKEEMKL